MWRMIKERRVLLKKDFHIIDTARFRLRMDNKEREIMGKKDLAFSAKYDSVHTKAYHEKHSASIGRRLSNWREQKISAKALEMAGNPEVVLDLPCGAGRFWPLLAQKKNREILAADNSEDMLRVAQSVHPAHLLSRIQMFQTSAFQIDLEDGRVDHIFCMRLMHHITQPEDRIAILREFFRVTRETVAVSLWVDGNFKAFKRKRLEARRTHKEYRNRIVIERSAAEREFTTAGLDVRGHFDFMKYYAMWRIYILEKRT